MNLTNGTCPVANSPFNQSFCSVAPSNTTTPILNTVQETIAEKSKLFFGAISDLGAQAKDVAKQGLESAKALPGKIANSTTEAKDCFKQSVQDTLDSVKNKTNQASEKVLESDVYKTSSEYILNNAFGFGLAGSVIGGAAAAHTLTNIANGKVKAHPVKTAMIGAASAGILAGSLALGANHNEKSIFAIAALITGAAQSVWSASAKATPAFVFKLKSKTLNVENPPKVIFVPGLKA